jgi:2-polyprenyl-3-methyl-5-hydroxy-6-metoxy-1,4-benzoquinol methylase
MRKNNHGNVEYYVASGELYDASSRFDLIICSQILEHIHNPLAMLDNLKRLLKDDGVIFIGVPNGFGDFEIENFIPRMLSKNRLGNRLIRKMMGDSVRDSLNTESQHVQFFTFSKLMKLLEKVGLYSIENINEEFIGGVITNRIMARLPMLFDWNMNIANKVPAQFANSWIVICKKK